MGRESASKRLGIKLFDGELVKAGNVLVRQRGTKWVPGKNVKRGNDDTLYALRPGVIKFTDKKAKRYDGSRRIFKVINVI